MKLSELSTKDAAKYLKLFAEDLTQRDWQELEMMLDAARAIIRNTTGNDAEQCDAHPEFVIAALLLVQDMFDNRTCYRKANEAAPNRTLDAILGLHDYNLI